jgi:RHS repeat-associated protein
MIAQETNPAAVAAGVPKQRLEHTYDSDGRRVRLLLQTWDATTSTWTTTTDTRYAYDGYNECANWTIDPTTSAILQTQSLLWGLDLSQTEQGVGGVGGLIAIHTSSFILLPCYDGNGNITAYLDATTQEPVAQYDYDAFGNQIPLKPFHSSLFTLHSSYGFSTKPTDPITHWSYYTFRHYDPVKGRWTSRDPLGEIGGNNLLSYIYNNPIVEVDYLGLIAMDSVTASIPYWVAQGYTVAQIAAITGLEIVIIQEIVSKLPPPPFAPSPPKPKQPIPPVNKPTPEPIPRSPVVPKPRPIPPITDYVPEPEPIPVQPKPGDKTTDRDPETCCQFIWRNKNYRADEMGDEFDPLGGTSIDWLNYQRQASFGRLELDVIAPAQGILPPKTAHYDGGDPFPRPTIVIEAKYFQPDARGYDHWITRMTKQQIDGVRWMSERILSANGQAKDQIEVAKRCKLHYKWRYNNQSAAPGIREKIPVVTPYMEFFPYNKPL